MQNTHDAQLQTSGIASAREMNSVQRPHRARSSQRCDALRRRALASKLASGSDRRRSLLVLLLLLSRSHHHHLLLHHHHYRLHIILFHCKSVAQRVTLLLQVRLLPLQEILRRIRRFLCHGKGAT